MTEIANRFQTSSPVVSSQPYGMGHINRTYLVTAANGEKYVLQKINDAVFADVDGLMSNICGVTEYIAKQSAGGETLRVIKTVDGKPYLRCEEGCFRMYNFVSGQTVETGATLKQFELAGKAFGRFQKLLDGYPSDKLVRSLCKSRKRRRMRQGGRMQAGNRVFCKPQALLQTGFGFNR